VKDNFYKITLIFDKKQKIRIFVIILLLILLAFFELVGISLFLPLIGLLVENSDSAYFVSSDFIATFKKTFNINSSINFALLIILLIFFIKFIFVNIVNIYSNNIIFQIQQRLKEKLFNNYLNRNYLSFIKDNASYATRTIIENSNQFTVGILKSFITFVAEFFLLIFIFSFLIYLNPKSALTVFIIFGVFSFFFLKILEKNLIKWGEQKNYHVGETLKVLQESLKGFKEIKISNLLNFFFMKFKFHNKHATDASRKQVISSTIPQYYLELIAILSFTIFIISLTFQGMPGKDIIIYLGVYSVAAFKILPSVNRLINSYNTIKFGQACINNIIENITYKTSEQNLLDVKYGKLDTLKFKDINFFYEKEKIIFKSLEITLNKKKIIGIFGESGSGKSTFVNLICGIIKPTFGYISYNDTTIHDNIVNYQKKLGVVPQDVFILDNTIKNNIAIGVEDNDVDNDLMDECLKQAHLYDFVNALPKKYLTRLGENGVFLSGGQKQRIGIARALYKKAEIIIFDESTNSLDEYTERELMQNIQLLKETALIIFITHKKNLQTFFDESYFLSDKNFQLNNKSKFI
jgi:ABC-type multidrug transport system fused ATPase/permease subunit